MSDFVTDSPPNGLAVNQALADLDRRVHSLEIKVAALPDVKQIEDCVAEKIQSSMPPPIDPIAAPSFKDIQIPIPSVQSVVATAKTTWMLFEMFAELKMLFWTLFDRRYHMAWITRLVTIALVVMILSSHWWAPFASWDNFVSHLWDKLIDLVLGLILFMVLSFETRRYKDWRSKR